jgi:NRE family putative nickel resistance protein-like MFS transporter
MAEAVFTQCLRSETDLGSQAGLFDATWQKSQGSDESMSSIIEEAPASHEERRRKRFSSGRYGRVLSNKRFRLLWTAQLFGSMGETISQIVFPLFVYDLTESAGLLGTVYAAQRAAQLAISPITGVVADRFNRRNIILTCDLSRALLLALMPFMSEVWQVALIAVLVSVASAFARPAEQAAVPAIVGPDDLVPALSLTQVSYSVLRIVGPALGGATIGLVGPKPAFWLQTAIYFCSFLLVLRLDLGKTVAPATGKFFESAWRDFVDGLHTVWSNPIVRAITATETLWSLVGSALTIATVVLAKETLDLGKRADTVYSLLTASLSAGAVIGALIAHRVESRWGRARLMAVGYVGPLFLAPVLFNPPLSLDFFLWFMLGFTDAWAVISFQSYLAEEVPDELRGRVYATWGAMVTAGWLVSGVIIGWAADAFGAPLTLGLAGLIVGVGGPLLLVASGAASALRHPTAASV